MCRPPTQESLVSWTSHLQDYYPSLKDVTVIYNVTVLNGMRDWSDTMNSLHSNFNIKVLDETSSK